MLSLTIQHLIHLTRDQRYALHTGIEIVVAGISIPVWHMDKTTSEPAREVFCKYYLSNGKDDLPIQIRNDGYEVSIPHREGKKLDITDEQWLDLGMNNPEELEKLYQKCISEVSSKNLLDICDGGCQCLAYREHNKLKQENNPLNVVHFMQIVDMGKLVGSL